MKARDIMIQSVRTCRMEESLNIPAQQMWEGDCGAIAVTNPNGTVVGMITDRDICMATYTQGLPPHAIQVKSAMSKEVFGCSPDDSLMQVERVMCEHRVRRLPVIDDKGALVGIISLNDIARHVDEHKGARGNGFVETMAAICEPRHLVAAVNHAA